MTSESFTSESLSSYSFDDSDSQESLNSSSYFSSSSRSEDEEKLSTKNYKWMSLSSVLKWENEAKDLGVSKIARSKSGFLTAYKRYKTKNNMPEKWVKKRNGFIARHMAQYKKNPTYRRWLALVMWAYKPPGKIPH